MGVLAVLGVYFLVLELLRERKNDTIPLVASFLMAISPWSIQFSRVAFEANSGVTLNIWAVAAFLAGLKRRVFLPVSAALFALGLYAYHSERVFLPLLLVLLLVVYRRELFVKKQTKMLMLSAIVGIFAAAPLIPVVFNQTALMRLRGTSVFTDQTQLLARDIAKLQRDQLMGDRMGKLLDNRRIIFVKTVIAGYLSHFSFKWLFLTGDNQRHHAPDMGLLYLWELPFLLYGLYRVFKYMKGPVASVLVGWLLISPVAASVTTGLPHAVRTLVFLPSFQVITAIGVVAAIGIGQQYASGGKRLCYWMGILGVSLFAIFNFAYYLDMYFVQLNPEVSQYWQYGYKDAVAYTEKVKTKYQKIVVSTTLEQSYMFFLFYTKYDPVKYLAAGGTQSGSFEANNHFENYEFRKIDWEHEKRDGTILYVGDPKDMPHGNVMNYKFLDGTPAIEMADSASSTP
jgi:hypothetical protein